MYATVSTRLQAQSAAMRPVQTTARTSVVAHSTLSPAHLASFKADDLSELCRKKGVTGGRNATRESLSAALVKAGVSVADLSRHQLTDLGVKLGKPSLPRDLNAARSELAKLLGGGASYGSSSSSASSWRTSSPAASTGRFDSYASKSSTPRASSGSAAGGALSHSDLAVLRIDDLRDLVKVTGVELPREPTKDGLISSLVAKGVNLSHCTRGMLVDLCNKLGASMAKDAESMRRNLSAVVGRGAGAGAAPAASSWRNTPAAPAAGGRFSSYSAGASDKASWRRSGSYSAGSGAGLSAADFATLRIDDLSTIAKKIGAELPRNLTKDGLISLLVSKNVPLSALPRGVLVDLCTRKGVPTAKDAATMIRNLSGAVGGAAPAASSGSSSSWRSTPSAAPATNAGGRFASYNGNGSSSSSSWRAGGSSSASSGGGSDAIFEADLASFKIDDLTQLARKVGIDVRNATKTSLVRSVTSKATVADLSKGNLVDILSQLGQSISGSVEDLRSRVRSAASQRQSARALAGARR